VTCTEFVKRLGTRSNESPTMGVCCPPIIISLTTQCGALLRCNPRALCTMSVCTWAHHSTATTTTTAVVVGGDGGDEDEAHAHLHRDGVARPHIFEVEQKRFSR
jgi:hypothetical protein